MKLLTQLVEFYINYIQILIIKERIGIGKLKKIML